MENGQRLCMGAGSCRVFRNSPPKGPFSKSFGEALHQATPYTPMSLSNALSAGRWDPCPQHARNYQARGQETGPTDPRLGQLSSVENFATAFRRGDRYKNRALKT